MLKTNSVYIGQECRNHYNFISFFFKFSYQQPVVHLAKIVCNIGCSFRQHSTSTVWITHIPLTNNVCSTYSISKGLCDAPLDVTPLWGNWGWEGLYRIFFPFFFGGGVRWFLFFVPRLYRGWRIKQHHCFIVCYHTPYNFNKYLEQSFNWQVE